MVLDVILWNKQHKRMPQKKLCMRKWLIKGKQTEIIMMTKD